MSERRIQYVREHPNGPQIHSIHKWLNRHHPRTGTCEYCEREAKTQWALNAEQYSKDIRDYIELCQPCHARKDAGLS